MLKNWFNQKFIQPALDKVLTVQLMKETDDTFKIGTAYGSSFRDRFSYDRNKILKDALLQWRINPIARRIVELTTSFVIGKGVEFSSDGENILLDFWHHELNRIPEQLPAWTGELSRSGDLFLLFSNTEAGIFVRAFPPEQITEIETAENDFMQEKKFIYGTDAEKDFYPAYTPNKKQKTFMRHYSINKPVAVTFGESDFTPILPWLTLYTDWLENRAKLNKYRTAFMFVLRGKFASKAERIARQAEIAANPPQSGSVLIQDESESWGILSANLDSFDANVDGLAIKRMIATAAGIPMHWLSEPESSTRTTAIAAGTPTFRKLSARQNVVKNIVTDILKIVLTQKGIKTDSLIVRMDDITQKDNTATALAIARAEPTLADIFDRELIDGAELIRMIYRLAGEEAPADVGAGLRKPLTASKEKANTILDPELEDVDKNE